MSAPREVILIDAASPFTWWLACIGGDDSPTALLRNLRGLGWYTGYLPGGRWVAAKGRHRFTANTPEALFALVNGTN